MKRPCDTVRLAGLVITFAAFGIARAQELRIGRVVDPTEVGIANAELRLVDTTSQRVIVTTRTRASGAYALDVSAVDERTALFVTANDFAELRLSSDELHDAGTMLRLRPAATMTGRVTDKQSRAIEGASIVVATRAQDGSADDFRWTATTDAQGMFTIADVPVGSVHVAIAAAGYHYLDAAKTWSGDRPCDFVLEPGDEPAFSVVVRDAAGRPMPGCEVRVHAFPQHKFASPLPPLLAHGVTDAAGTWSAHGPEKLDYRITVHKAGFEDSLEQSVSIGQRMRERTFVMRPLEERTVRAHVIDDSGSPLPNLVVHAFDAKNRLIGTATTDTRGAIATKTFLRRGDGFRLSLPSWPHALGPHCGVPFCFEPELDYELTIRPTTVLRGSVFGADGLPAAHQVVWLSSKTGHMLEPDDPDWRPRFRVTTDRRGKFEFVGGVPSDYADYLTNLRLETAGGGGWAHSDTFNLDRAAASTAFELRCMQGACLRGHVVDDNGLGLAGILLKVRRGQPTTRDRRRRTHAEPSFETTIPTSRDGRFVLSGLAPGDYCVLHTPAFDNEEYVLTQDALMLKSNETLDVKLVVH